MITPSQIREKKLSTVENGGYNKDEVNELLLDVIESYEAVYAENKELYRKMEILANRIEEYRADEDSIKAAIINAQKMATQVVNEAKEKAEKSISESASSAQQTVLDAKAKAEKIIGDARDYVANLTQEKEKAAGEIVSEAEQKANAAINGAKLVAQNAIDEAKSVSKEIIEKAKAEKEFNQNITAKLKEESKSFKASLVSLYETQLQRLKVMVEYDGDSDIESEFNELINNIDNLSQDSIPEPEEIEEAVQENEEVVQQEADDEQEIIILDDEEEDELTAEEEPVADEKIDAVDDIIEEINEISIAEEKEIEPLEESPEKVADAINAFSSDEITPINEDATSIPVIEEEVMPFENYFNVNKEDPHNTNETISLLPPDEDDEDDTAKFKGFFRKKK